MPTAAGQHFYERVRQAIETADEAERVARGEGAGLVGRLRVCTAVTVARDIMPRLPSFPAAQPNLSIDFVLDDRAVNLMEEGIDIAFRRAATRFLAAKG